MAQVFSYGELGTFEHAFHILASWRLFEGVEALAPNETHETAVLYFKGEPEQVWLIIQAVPHGGGQKSYIYRTISIDPVPQPFVPAISIDVWFIPTFADVLGELEAWFLDRDMPGTDDEKQEVWTEVIKGLSVLA
jgi:hypothetical protein